MIIIPQVQKNLLNGVKNIANNKRVLKHIDNVLTNEAAAAKTLIMTNVCRDAVNYTIYFNQSLNNKKIPDDKRKFVAAFDLANGILVCASQICLGFLFTNKELNNKICKKLFNGLDKVDENLFNKCKKGYTIVFSLILSSIIAKRVIVPFIAAPLASWIKNKFLLKDQDNNTQKYMYKDAFQYAMPVISYRGKSNINKQI